MASWKGSDKRRESFGSSSWLYFKVGINHLQYNTLKMSAPSFDRVLLGLLMLRYFFCCISSNMFQFGLVKWRFLVAGTVVIPPAPSGIVFSLPDGWLPTDEKGELFGATQNLPNSPLEQCSRAPGWLFDIGDEILANYMGIILVKL